MKLSLAALVVSAFALLLLAIAGPLYRVGVLGLPSAFGLLRWAAYVGLAGALAALLVLVWTWRRGARVAAAVSLVAMLLAIVSVAIPYRWQLAAQSAPPIHDISTDLENPPAFKAIVPLRADAPNPLDRSPLVADQQRRGYPDIQPLTVSAPRDQVFARAIALMQQSDWDIANQDKAAGIIEATDTTAWFGFKDDIVVRLTPWGSGTRVDVRSVSRVGRSDVGTNARRVREFLAALKDTRTAGV
jgi:uncharacterized protein (DUF1499 family)